MTHMTRPLDDQTDAEAAGYTCGVCLDDESLSYTDDTTGPCPNCQPEPLTRRLPP